MKRKVTISLSILFSLGMAGLFIFYLIKHDHTRWQVALGGIFVSLLPLGLLKMKNNPFNTPIIVSYYLFLFCSLYLGSISSFYLHFEWWDSTLHFFKGMFVGFVGISLYKHWVPPHTRSNVSTGILFLFVLSLAVSSSVLWEIYEFVGDLTLTHTMQRGGNKDTMLDLLCGFAGGLITAFYSLLRKRSI
ncbi:membrane-spanning protein [Neobacillus drentensis]|uniref:membrane-spanning protein n=1 Tax=Neobacillus drentensis TaxID=220684 RepID=UPI001F3BFCF7|nr:membrane-spanning protein [Neobacillus drentensis]ULT55206.1 membrane-spanning protein [Neobacillus drentensis]